MTWSTTKAEHNNMPSAIGCHLRGWHYCRKYRCTACSLRCCCNAGGHKVHLRAETVMARKHEVRSSSYASTSLLKVVHNTALSKLVRAVAQRKRRATKFTESLRRDGAQRRTTLPIWAYRTTHDMHRCSNYEPLSPLRARKQSQ